VTAVLGCATAPESVFPRLEPLLMRVGKPVQYVGGELNAIVKDWSSCNVRWCLMYPDAYEVGQPNQDCEELIASQMGSDPGNSSSSGHSAFGGSAGDVYAGSQPQNSRNSVSVSQYDVACSKQPM